MPFLRNVVYIYLTKKILKKNFSYISKLSTLFAIVRIFCKI